MRTTNDTRQKHCFDCLTPQDHILDAAHLLARAVMLMTSMACW